MKLFLVPCFLASLSLAFECGDQLGVIPDPDDCQSFYQCSFDIAEHYQCSPGFLFDATLLVCNYEYNVDCGNRPRPDGSTQSSTASTTPLPTASTSPGEVTTTSMTTRRTTTTHNGDSHFRFPDKIMGIYIILADETEDGFHDDSDWEPKLYPYQQEGANVLFFTFVNPNTMVVPKPFAKLAATRGSEAEGAVPKDTVILFAIGGYSYSINYNPWHWLTSREAAEAMAEEVATWPDRYGCDGIDLDIEEGAGGQAEAGPNLVHFVNKLRSIKPDILIGQPTYGYPQVQAANDIINESWDTNGNAKNVLDSVGLMVYEGTESLRYVDNYVHGTEQYEGFPIKVNVNAKAVVLGCKGSSSYDTIMTLARESVNQDLLGIMVWYASVQNGFQYAVSWDASSNDASKHGYIDALKYFNSFNK